jgi:hypothetical protein
MKAITLIKTINPAKVGKSYRLVNGKLTKHAVADVWEGIGETVHVETAEAMVELLMRVTNSTNLVLCNGIFGGGGNEQFTILTSKRFREIVEADGADFATVRKEGKLYRPKTGKYAGKLVGARIKDLQTPSSWTLLDADEPKGFPDDWRGLTFHERLALLEQYAPGISTAERVELRGSSARVVIGSGGPPAPSHGWICCDDPEDIARAAIALQIHATAGGTYFASPRHSRTTGEVIGAQARTSIDLAPWHRGRLNFDSMPTIDAKGYTLADAGITIVNPGGGMFSPGGVAKVTKATTTAYREKTGHTIRVNSRGTGAMQTVAGQLTLTTQVDVKGELRTLEAWADYMTAHGIEKLRCEAPFRASESEAAFIGWGQDGPFIFDIGVATKYVLAEADDEVEADDTPDPEDELHSVYDEFDDTPEPEEPLDQQTDDFDIVAEGEDDVDAGTAEEVETGGTDDQVDGDAAEEADDFDPSIPLTVEDVKKADITSPKGVRIVDTYRTQQLDKLNRSIGYAMIEGKGVIVRVGPNGIGELGIQFIAIDAERNRLANRAIPYVSGSKEPVLKWTKIFPWWLEWSGRRTYDGIVFNPKPEVVATRRMPSAARNGMAPLNLFVGYSWEPVAGDCNPILTHIHEVLCGSQMEATRYTLSWMARMVQKPAEPAETVLVFRSGQGAGKNTITNILRSYFGAHGLELTNDKHLTGFNDHLATSIFVHLNEAVWGGNKQAEGSYKSLITEREITVERKYVPAFRIKNRTHLIVSTNNDWAVPVGHDDRRYVVMNPSNHRVGDVAYFQALHSHIANGGDKAFIHYLLKRDISGFNPRVLPTVVGPIKLEQKIQSANTVAQWLMGVLQDGGLHVQEDEPSAPGTRRVWVDIGMGLITKDALYREYFATVRVTKPEIHAQFCGKLQEILEGAVSTARPRTNNYRPAPRVSAFQSSNVARPTCFQFHQLDQLRAAFSAYIGEDVAW